MGRGIYRIYLYVVVIGALVNVAYWLYNFLHIVLPILFLPAFQHGGEDPARAAYQVLVALAISALLGGSHYAWIRKDIGEDETAGSGLIRSVALNLTQTTAAVAGLVAGILTLEYVDQLPALAQSPAADQWATTLAISIVAALVFLLLQFERQRTKPAHGAPLAAQRAHLYFVQSVALVATFVTWYFAIAGGAGHATWPFGALPPTTGGLALSTLFAAEVWLLYFFLARGDMPSLLRFATQLFGFTFGLACTIAGEWGAVADIFGTIWHASKDYALGLTAPYNFISFLTFGVLVMIGYGFWLAWEADQNSVERAVTELTVLAVSALVLGAAFYVAVTLGLYNVLNRLLLPSGSQGNEDVWLAIWASAIGLLMAGLAHPFMAYVLRQRSVHLTLGHRFPRQGFVLGALAAGFLTIAFAFVLIEITAHGGSGGNSTQGDFLGRLGRAAQAFWTTLNPPCTTCKPGTFGLGRAAALATVLVGLFIIVVHWRRAIVEGWLLHLRAPEKPPVPERADPSTAGDEGTFGAVVDDLLAERITREQAIARMRALARRGKVVR